MKITPSMLKPLLDLAVLANGGSDFRKEWCQCDPSVGMVPCQYCASYNLLQKLEQFIKQEGSHED